MAVSQGDRISTQGSSYPTSTASPQAAMVMAGQKGQLAGMESCWSALVKQRTGLEMEIPFQLQFIGNSRACLSDGHHGQAVE